MVGSNVNLPEEENTPEKRVERIFNLMDKVSFNLKYSLIHETYETFWPPFSKLTILKVSKIKICHETRK